MHKNNKKLEDETLKKCNLFLKRMDVLSAKNFHGVHMIVIPVVEDLITLNILVHDINIANGKVIDQLARRIVQKKENTAIIQIKQLYMLCEQNFCNLSLAPTVISSTTEHLTWSDI